MDNTSEFQKGSPSHQASDESETPKKECAICWEILESGKGQAIFTAECSHSFHFNCIATSVMFGNRVCPICRSTWNNLPFQYDPRQHNPTPLLHVPPLQPTPSPFFQVPHNHQPTPNPFSRVPQHYPNARPHFPQFPSDDEIQFSDDEPLLISSESASPSSQARPQTVTLKALPELPAIVASESVSTFSVLVNVQAPPLSDNAHDMERAHIDLVLVLDVSGSMSGPKLALLKSAVRFIIDNLGPYDRLAMVAFSSQAKRIFPLHRMSNSGREDAIRSVDSLSAYGGTNIVQGLKKGVRVLEERRAQNSVSSIIFLSDGMDSDNCRQYSFSRISSDSRQLPEYLNLLPNSIYPRHDETGDEVQQSAIPVHSFGFGSDHDSATMHAIADASGGTYSFIESISIIQDAFARCIGGLLSVVVQELQLTLNCTSPGGHIVSIPSGRYQQEISQEGQQGVINVGDLYADENKDFLVLLSVPMHTYDASQEEGETTLLLDIKCSYKDVVTKEIVHIECDRVEIRRPQVLPPEDAAVNLEVDRQRNRVLVTEGIAEARRLADCGNIADAQALLADRISSIRSSPSAQARDSFCTFLEAEMEEIRDRMRSVRIYQNSGRAHLLAGLSSHNRQRATTRCFIGAARSAATLSFGQSNNGGCYSTPTINRMVNKSQNLGPIVRENAAAEQSDVSGSGTSTKQ